MWTLATQSLSARRAWIEIKLAKTSLTETEVALRKESVDRNHVVLVVPACCWLSLSARRAWIEISQRRDFKAFALVALRKESVDRNCRYPACCVVLLSSLSARRAWIEIHTGGCWIPFWSLSLSARRAWIEILVGRPQGRWQPGRSPQGERG